MFELSIFLRDQLVGRSTFSLDEVRIGRRVARLPAISGMVPTLYELPPGCPFQNRCPRVVERCHAERPAMATVAPDHELACFNPVDDR